MAGNVTQALAQGSTSDVAIKTTPIALRLPNDLLARIDERREKLRKMGGIEPNRTDMIKFLIERGIEALETEEKPAKGKR